ncbi:MAG: hypothetical protein U1E06_16065 [Tabrizicola sp.]|uniref:hypothetical protein n=1 Tax=Tabrizicola sp. TaxID=2005166 RepID=UPI0027357314|nr:hypothetical protein [Tabrizicola sp.]MDP3264029.1 hypothetical protein [Tabrizicola sp.]MDP3649665.1 hypothetical protein [Paracoccaceae bacterium]MDZ4068342.1 hypothetical protein [Tabrizicola sp.]
MTRSKAPPPIKPVANKLHEKWGDISGALKKATVTPPSGMAEVRFAYLDQFAPSSAKAFTTDADGLSNPSARHIFYNQQLYGLLCDAITEAVTLGLPPIDLNFPLTFARVSKGALKYIFGIANGLSQSIGEGSFGWLCIQCYIQYALLCNDLTEPLNRQVEALPGEDQDSIAFRQRGLESIMVSSHAFFLGAAVRELELALLNKKDALRGKRTIKAARAGAEGRKNSTAPDTEARLSKMRELVAKNSSVANAARLTANSVGGTVASNRKLWGRHAKK